MIFIYAYIQRHSGKLAMEVTELKSYPRIVRYVPVQTPYFHEPNLIRIKADPNYLDRLN